MIDGIRGILFDMDGLLFDTERVWQKHWRIAANEHGYEYPEDFPLYISGTSGPGMLRVIRQFFPAVDAETFSALVHERVHEELTHGVEPMPGMYEILAQAKEKGYLTSIASSSTMEQIESNLEKAGARHYFDALTSGREVKSGKPEPDIFLLAAKRLGLDPSECLVFEDGLNGVKAAYAAGCQCIMIPDLVPADEFAKGYCMGIYDSLEKVEL